MDTGLVAHELEDERVDNSIVPAAVTATPDVVSSQSADTSADGGTADASRSNTAYSSASESADDGAIASVGSVGAGDQRNGAEQNSEVERFHG